MIQESVGSSGGGGTLLQIAGPGWSLVPGDQVLGQHSASGYHGARFWVATSIKFQIEDAAAPNSMPGVMSFLTTPVGATALVEPTRISSDGKVAIEITNPQVHLDVAGAMRPGVQKRRAQKTSTGRP